MAEKYLTIEDLDTKIQGKEKEFDDLKKTHDQQRAEIKQSDKKEREAEEKQAEFNERAA